MIKNKDKKVDPEKNFLIKLFRRWFPVVDRYEGDKFFIKLNGKTYATLLFIVLLFVEITDLIFAVDSIPAILAITSDTFIVYTSNVFAILGLRSLYFALAGVMYRFKYLVYGLAIVLMFVGLKMCFTDIFKVPTEYSLLFILFAIGGSILYSIAKTKSENYPVIGNGKSI